MAGFFEEERDNNGGRERQRDMRRNICRVRDRWEAQGKQKNENRAASCSENSVERATVTTEESKDKTYEGM